MKTLMRRLLVASVLLLALLAVAGYWGYLQLQGMLQAQAIEVTRVDMARPEISWSESSLRLPRVALRGHYQGTGFRLQLQNLEVVGQWRGQQNLPVSSVILQQVSVYLAAPLPVEESSEALDLLTLRPSQWWPDLAWMPTSVEVENWRIDGPWQPQIDSKKGLSGLFLWQPERFKVGVYAHLAAPTGTGSSLESVWIVARDDHISGSFEVFMLGTDPGQVDAAQALPTVAQATDLADSHVSAVYRDIGELNGDLHLNMAEQELWQLDLQAQSDWQRWLPWLQQTQTELLPLPITEPVGSSAVTATWQFEPHQLLSWLERLSNGQTRHWLGNLQTHWQHSGQWARGDWPSAKLQLQHQWHIRGASWQLFVDQPGRLSGRCDLRSLERELRQQLTLRASEPCYFELPAGARLTGQAGIIDELRFEGALMVHLGSASTHLQMAANAVNVQLSGGQAAGTINGSLNGLALPEWPYSLRAQTVDGDWSFSANFDNQRWQWRPQGRVSQDRHLTGSMHWHSTDLVSDLLLFQDFLPKPTDFVIESGQFDLQLSANNADLEQDWRAWPIDVTGQLDGVSLLLAPWRVADLKVRWQAQPDQALRLWPFEVSSPGIGGPIAIDQLSLKGQLQLDPQLEPQGVLLQKANIRVFDGAVTLREPAQFALQPLTGLSHWQLEKIKLQQLVALQGQQGLDAIGELNGNLPLQIQADGVALENGEVWALPPGGVVRYRPAGVEAMKQQAGQLSVALEVLDNFHYNALLSKVNYAAEEDQLSFDVSFRGKNPDYEGGHPVDLNLNLQSNVMPLIRSLTLTDRLNEEVEKAFGQ